MIIYNIDIICSYLVQQIIHNASRLEAIASTLEAIAIFNTSKTHSSSTTRDACPFISRHVMNALAEKVQSRSGRMPFAPSSVLVPSSDARSP